MSFSSEKAKAGLNLWPKETCLISELSRTLSLMPPEVLAKTLVILPTQRLNTFLLASLAKLKTAFIPPHLETLDGFIWQHGADLEAAPVVVSSLEESLILTKLIDTSHFRHINHGHHHEITHLFSEMAKDGLAEDGFQRLNEALLQDAIHGEQEIASLLERVAELTQLFTGFKAELASLGLKTKAEAQKEAAFNLEKKLSETEFALPYKNIFIVGFTSAASVYLPVLKKMATSESCQIWLTEPPELLSSENPLLNLCNALGKAHFAGKNASPEPGKLVFAKNFDQIEEEINYALKSAKIFHKRHKLALSQIAILVTNEGDYGPLLRQLAAKQGLRDVNIALANPISQTHVGTWLKHFFDFILGSKPTLDIIPWLFHPLTMRWLEKKGAATKEFALNTLLSEEFSRADGAWSIKELKSNCRDLKCQEALQSCEEILETFKTGGKEQTLLAHAVKLKLIFDEFAPRVQKDTNPNAVMEQAACDLIKNYFATLETFSAYKDLNYSISHFYQLFITPLFSQDVRSIGEPLSGLQILSLSEARYFPFEAAIIVGASEGNLPIALAKDELLDDYLKRRMGLGGWRSLQAREELTFSLLRARLPVLGLFYSRQKLGEPLIASRFIEELKLEGAITKDVDALLGTEPKPQEDHLFEAEYLSASDHLGIVSEEGLYAKPREALFASMSASSLENLIRCPYRFLVQRLGLKDFSLPSSAVDPKKEGDWLHKVLQHLFFHWPTQDLDKDEFFAFTLERLTSLTKQFGPPGSEHSALFVHLRRYGWPKLTSFLWQVCEKRGSAFFGKALSEVAFHPQKAIRSEDLVGEVATNLVGSIDCLVPSNDATLLVDFKRKSLPAPRNLKLGISPQLAFYALCLNNISEETSLGKIPLSKVAAGYWSILNGEWIGAAYGDGDEAKVLASEAAGGKKGLKLEELVETMKTNWRWRMDQLLSEKAPFFADTSVAQSCSFCNYQSLCRKSDSRYARHLDHPGNLQSHLKPPEASQ